MECVDLVKLGLLFRKKFMIALEDYGTDNKGRRVEGTSMLVGELFEPDVAGNDD